MTKVARYVLKYDNVRNFVYEELKYPPRPSNQLVRGPYALWGKQIDISVI